MDTDRTPADDLIERLAGLDREARFEARLAQVQRQQRRWRPRLIGNWISIIASRRGAQAWDWKAGRYRLMGKPADRVQQADGHKAQDPRR